MDADGRAGGADPRDHALTGVARLVDLLLGLAGGLGLDGLDVGEAGREELDERPGVAAGVVGLPDDVRLEGVGLQLAPALGALPEPGQPRRTVPLSSAPSFWCSRYISRAARRAQYGSRSILPVRIEGHVRQRSPGSSETSAASASSSSSGPRASQSRSPGSTWARCGSVPMSSSGPPSTGRGRRPERSPQSTGSSGQRPGSTSSVCRVADGHHAPRTHRTLRRLFWLPANSTRSLSCAGYRVPNAGGPCP